MPLNERLQGFSDDPQTLVDTIWAMLRQNQAAFLWDNVQILDVREREVHVIRYEALEPQSRHPPNHWWEPIEALLYGAKYLGTFEEMAWLRPRMPVVRRVPSEDPSLNGVWRINFVAIGSISLESRQRQGVEQMSVDRPPISEFLQTYRRATPEELLEEQQFEVAVADQPEVAPEAQTETPSRTSLWQLIAPETPIP